MRTCAISLVVLGVLVMLGSMVRTPGEHDMVSGIGIIRYSPRLCMTTPNGWYGITESSMQTLNGLRKFETDFHFGLHFVKLSFSAPVAAALVGVPIGSVGLLLLFIAQGKG